MFNTMQFAVGFLLAENEKKRLKDSGVEVPNNFTMNNSILFGAMGNSAAPAIFLQNEVHKKDKEIQEKNAAEVLVVQKRFNDANKDVIKLTTEKATLTAERDILQKQLDDFKKNVKNNFAQIKSIVDDPAKAKAVVDKMKANASFVAKYLVLDSTGEIKSFKFDALAEAHMDLAIYEKDFGFLLVDVPGSPSVQVKVASKPPSKNQPATP